MVRYEENEQKITFHIPGSSYISAIGLALVFLTAAVTFYGVTDSTGVKIFLGFLFVASLVLFIFSLRANRTRPLYLSIWRHNILIKFKEGFPSTKDISINSVSTITIVQDYKLHHYGSPLQYIMRGKAEKVAEYNMEGELWIIINGQNSARFRHQLGNGKREELSRIRERLSAMFGEPEVRRINEGKLRQLEHIWIIKQ